MERLKENLEKTSPSRVGKVGIYAILIGIGAGWVLFPYTLDFILGKKLALVEGTDTRTIWAKLPPMITKIYLFNVTNHIEVQSGAIPVLEEIGPYCFVAYKEKLDLIDDEESDTVSYSPVSTWHWKSTPSCRQELTGDEVIVQPNAFLLALLLKARKDFPTPLLAVVNEALPSIYGRLKDVFLTAKARDLLFDGILINCTDRSILPRAICIAIKQNSKPLVQVSPNVYRFSYLGARNSTVEEYRYTIMRGTNNVLDIGRMVQIDGKTELPFWKGECNRIFGTDSTIFPPYRRDDNTSVSIYSSELCRILRSYYDGKVVYRKITGYKYVFTLGDAVKDPNQQCYCSNKNECKKGVSDINSCLGAPLTATFPHFYDASPEFERGVIGLKPNKDLHAAYAILEPTSGVPLQGRRRLQINIQLKSVRYVPITRKLKPTLCPLIWLEEMFDLDDNFISMLQSQLLLGMTTMDTVKWTLIAAGSGLAGVSAILFTRKRNNRKKDLNKNINFNNNDDISVIKILPENDPPIHEKNLEKNGVSEKNIQNDFQTNLISKKIAKYSNNEVNEILLPGMLSPLTMNTKINNILKSPEQSGSMNHINSDSTTNFHHFKMEVMGKEEKYFITRGTMTGEEEGINYKENEEKENNDQLYRDSEINNGNEEYLKIKRQTNVFSMESILNEFNNQRKQDINGFKLTNSLNNDPKSETDFSNNIERLEQYHLRYNGDRKFHQEDYSQFENPSYIKLNESGFKVQCGSIEKESNGYIENTKEAEISKGNMSQSIPFTNNLNEISVQEEGLQEDGINIIHKYGKENNDEEKSTNLINADPTFFTKYTINEIKEEEKRGEVYFENQIDNSKGEITVNEQKLNKNKVIELGEVIKKTEMGRESGINFDLNYNLCEEKDESTDKLSELQNIKNIRKNWKKILIMVKMAKVFRTYKNKDEMQHFVHSRFGEEIRDRNGIQNDSKDKIFVKQSSDSNLLIVSPRKINNFQDDGDLSKIRVHRPSTSHIRSPHFDKKYEDSKERMAYPKQVNLYDILDDDLSDGNVTMTGSWSGPLKRRRLPRRDSIISKDSSSKM